jgi:hypothetical protein
MHKCGVRGPDYQACRERSGRFWLATGRPPKRPLPGFGQGQSSLAARVRAYPLRFALLCHLLLDGPSVRDLAARGDDAFLDDRTLARVRLAQPALTEGALRQLYLDRVPSDSFRGSCIFHGSRGCTLDKSMRADVCNSYFCGGLGAYVKSCDRATPAMVIAGEGDKMRTSSVLMP